ncbi:hypothetical protein ABG768_027928 [Culter alburnus]|uniref:DUF6729 domain-containing protein n=1 Tax=Culter alburnus TaxID=194366 RepID=A0AAW2A7T7_CULAL
MGNWSCSQHQKMWMRMELQDLRLWPGSSSVRNLGNTISLWRLPPQPELVDTVAELPSPNFFQLHPFFIWKPESQIMIRLRNNYILPCLHGCTHPQVVSAGVGRPRVIVGTSGQYYILSSRLCCKACRKNWFADNPRWLEKLPKRFTNILPAFLTYKKAICKSVMDELRRTGKSPTDMANQGNELMHLNARSGPIKTGGRVFVLDHTRWMPPIKEAIDSLLQKYHGEKDILKLVDQDYADMVHQSATDPNSLLHPTTKLHISRYVKHMAKLLNTSSSLNTSQEKLLETQQLWHSLTEGSEMAFVPVVTIEPAIVNPPAPAPPLFTPLTQGSIEKIAESILEKQQHQPEQKRRQTKTCLACGQPKFQYETDGSSIHFFHQQGPVHYFYCSKKVYQSYAAEGLSNPKMPFEEFAKTEFFQIELEDNQETGGGEDAKMRKMPDTQQAGRLCRFCHMVLKQGPNSPHIHTGFPAVTEKYIYCPSKVYSST